MSSVRLVLVHGVDAMKKQSVSALVDYLGNPSPSTVLALGNKVGTVYERIDTVSQVSVAKDDIV